LPIPCSPSFDFGSRGGGVTLKIKKGVNKIMEGWILLVIVLVVVAGIIYSAIKKEKKGSK